MPVREGMAASSSTTFEEMMGDPQPPPDPGLEPPRVDQPDPYHEALLVMTRVVDVCVLKEWGFTLDITTPSTGASFRLTTPGPAHRP